MTCFKCLPAATLVVALLVPTAHAERDGQLVSEAECANRHDAGAPRAPSTRVGP